MCSIFWFGECNNNSDGGRKFSYAANHINTKSHGSAFRWFCPSTMSTSQAPLLSCGNVLGGVLERKPKIRKENFKYTLKNKIDEVKGRVSLGREVGSTVRTIAGFSRSLEEIWGGWVHFLTTLGCWLKLTIIQPNFQVPKYFVLFRNP